MLKPLLLALALSLPGLASANDTAFAAEGANLIPIKNDAVRMVDEHVVLEGQLYKDQLDAWKVTVSFHFKNESDKEQKLQMGFPFPKMVSEVPDRPVNVPHGRKPNDWLIYDFKASVRGKAVKPKEVLLKNVMKVEEDSPYSYAQVWDVTFKPGEEIEVVNSYLTGVTLNVMQMQYATYVLKTGANWKDGKIGRSLIEVKPNIPFITCKEGPDFGEEEVTKPEGSRIKGTGKDKKVVWDLKDFTPKDDVALCIYTDDSYRSVLRRLSLDAGELATIPPDMLRILRNQIYATYGYVFKSADLKERFEKEWWYQPNPKFDPKMLSEDDLKQIKAYKAEEQKRKADK